MKLLQIPDGGIDVVRMSQIQNLDTAAYIYKVTGGKIINNFDAVDILASPSNEYMKTVMTQSGYETISGKITGNGYYRTVRELKIRNFPLNPKYNKYKNPYEEFMKDNGLSWDSNLYIDYNIEINVK